MLIIARVSGYKVMPSIEVAKKIADALEVSLDYLAGSSKKAAIDKQTMKLIHDIENLEPSIKDKIIFLANAVIRDSKTQLSMAKWGQLDRFFSVRIMLQFPGDYSTLLFTVGLKQWARLLNIIVVRSIQLLNMLLQ